MRLNLRRSCIRAAMSFDVITNRNDAMVALPLIGVDYRTSNSISKCGW